MQDALVVHVENSKGYLYGPVQDLLLVYLAALAVLNDLAHVPTLAVLHHNVEAVLLVDKGISVRYDVYVFELLQQSHLVKDVLFFLRRLVLQVDLLDYVLSALLAVHGQIGVAERARCCHMYP